MRRLIALSLLSAFAAVGLFAGTIGISAVSQKASDEIVHAIARQHLARYQALKAQPLLQPMQQLAVKPAYADGPDGACGFPGDIDGQVNADGYAQRFMTVYDGLYAQNERIGFDIAAYRVTAGGSPLHEGDCYRSYYVSVWNDSRISMAALTAHMRVWVCGNPKADFQQVSYGVWGRAVVAYRGNQVWSDGTTWGQYRIPTNTPDGNVWQLDYQDYGTAGIVSGLCGRQLDNLISSFGPDSYYSPSSGSVYLNEGYF